MKQIYNEKFLEELIRDYPNEFLNENLILESQQEYLYGYRPDLIFRDLSGSLVIVEVQLHALDRGHLYRSLEYRDLLNERETTENVRVILVCNTLREKQKRISNLHGVEVIVIPKDVVVEKARKVKPDIELVDTGKEEEKADGSFLNAEQRDAGPTLSARSMKQILLSAPGARGKCASSAFLTGRTSLKRSLSTWVCGNRLTPLRIATPREERSPWIFLTAS